MKSQKNIERHLKGWVGKPKHRRYRKAFVRAGGWANKKCRRYIEPCIRGCGQAEQNLILRIILILICSFFKYFKLSFHFIIFISVIA